MHRSLISEYVGRPDSELPGDTPPPAHAGHKRPWHIRTTLAVLVAACLLPSALTSIGFTVADYQRQREQAVLGALSTARGLAAALDRDLASAESGLYVLAASDILAGDLQAFYQLAKAVLPYQNVSNYVLLDASGKQLLNTIKPWGTPLPATGGPPQLLRPFKTGEPVLTDLFVGPATGHPVIAIGVPVRRQGSIEYCLGAGIMPDRIITLLRAQHLPPGWIGAVLDGQGKIVARTHDADRFVGRSAVPDLVRKAKDSAEGRMETVTLEGIPVITVFSRSTISQWTIAIGVPKASLVSGLQRSFFQLALVNALLIAAALLLAWRVAVSRVAEPANRLLERMRRMTHGHDPGPLATSGASLEFVALEKGFDRMRKSLQQREWERETLVLRLSQTLESINDGFYLLDGEWRFAYVNQHAADMLGYARDALIQRDHWSVFTEAEATPMKEAYQRAIETRQAVSLETEWPSRKLWLEINAYPTDHGLSVYFRDISAIRQAQQAREAQLVAETANRSKTEFVSRMSHELRTPLNAVIGFAQILRMDVHNPLNEQQLGAIEHIEVAGKHMQDMIHDLLDLSSLEAGTIHTKIQTVDARLIVETCCEMMRAVATVACISITCTCEGEVAFVSADATRLKQVLLNLLSNAIKYNRAGGHVTVTARAEGTGTRFSVTDDGLGMTAAQLDHLFEPFNRLGRERDGVPGSGLGLIICKKMVELMGGELTVSSKDGLGSVFSFTLPTASASTEPHALAATQEAGDRGYGRRQVLCVEDNPINCTLIEATLAHRPDLEVTYVATVARAIAHLQHAQVDLILLDMHLPDGSGMDVIAWMRDHARNKIPVLVVSADATEEVNRTAREAGVSGYLPKPIDVAKTLAAIDAVFTTH